MTRELDWDEQDRRITEVVGTDEGDRAMARWFTHLVERLTLTCEVTGSEDFQWEEPYVLGVYSQQDYRRLRKTRPSFRDLFVLESIDQSAESEWAMYPDEIGASVTRKADGLRFLLGLSELRAVDEESANAQILQDYACWMVNYR